MFEALLLIVLISLLLLIIIITLLLSIKDLKKNNKELNKTILALKAKKQPSIELKSFIADLCTHEEALIAVRRLDPNNFFMVDNGRSDLNI